MVNVLKNKYPTKNELYTLYWNENKTLKQIAVLYCVSVSTIFLLFKKLGICTRHAGENSKTNNPMLGKKFTLEQIEHSRISHIGYKMPEEQKRKISVANKGRKVSDETKMKLRVANLGKTHLGWKRTESQKEEASRRMRGNTMSIEAKQKISAAIKTLWKNEEYRNLVISSRCEAIDNDEFRYNMKLELEKRWQNPEFVKKQMQSRHVTPNKTELKFLDIINSFSPQPFKYVGDGQLIIFGRCPDYVCETNDKLLVEFYGDYWHRGENPEDRITLFAEKGYKTLVIWEHELKDLKTLKPKIISFVSGVA